MFVFLVLRVSLPFVDLEYLRVVTDLRGSDKARFFLLKEKFAIVRQEIFGDSNSVSLARTVK